MRRVIGQGVRFLGIGVTVLWIAMVPLTLVVAARYIGLAQIATARAADAGTYVEAATVALLGVGVVIGLSIVLVWRPDHRLWLVSGLAALAVFADTATIAPTDRALVLPVSLAVPLAGSILALSLVGLALSLVVAPLSEPDRRRPSFMPPFAHHPD